MNVLVVEDDTIIAEKLEGYLKYFSAVEESFYATNISTALNILNKQKIDVILLDIKLEDGNGFQLLDKMKDRTIPIIFITAYQEFAVKAFAYSACDFILKPFVSTDVENALSKANTKLNRQKHYEYLLELVNNQQNTPSYIIINTHQKTYNLKIEDILYCEADGSYTNINQEDKSILTSKPLKFYENLLEKHGFLRVHQSYLVNLKEVQKILKQENSIELSNQTIIPISSRKRKDVLNALKNIS